jgi:hypothetical protein
VKQVSIPQRGGQKTPQRQAYEKTPAFKQGQRFPAGIEGRISVLFRGRGMKRCLAKGRERFEVLVAAAVLTNNLLRIAALLVEKKKKKNSRRSKAPPERSSSLLPRFSLAVVSFLVVHSRKTGHCRPFSATSLPAILPLITHTAPQVFRRISISVAKTHFCSRN